MKLQDLITKGTNHNASSLRYSFLSPMSTSSAAGIISLKAGNCSQGAARSNFRNSWASSTGS